MLRLLISLLVAGLIAGGIYYFLVYDDNTQPAELQNTIGPVENPSDAIEAANDAIQRSQSLQDKIDQRGQQAEEGN